VLNQPGIKLYLEVGGPSLPDEFRDFLVRMTSEPSSLSEKSRQLLGIKDDGRGNAG
jgi:hypothetical protein